MFYQISRYTAKVNFAYVAAGALDLAVPAAPQTVQQILRNYPNAWQRASACSYHDLATGQPLGALWAWGRRFSAGNGWPALVRQGGRYRIDEPAAADYSAADWAVAGGPVLVRGGEMTDVHAEAAAGKYPGLDPYAPAVRVGVGLRSDGTLVHAVALSHTLAELAAILLELGARTAIHLGPGGSPALYEMVNGAPVLEAGSDARNVPCALVALREAEMPAGDWHVLTSAESTPILGAAAATAAQMESFCHAVNPAAPFYAELYLGIGRRLGVRGDLAYAQALHETDYFRYTGDVQAWQFNMAGIGATGGVSGAVFSNPAEGILAHLEHLYAYATARPLPAGTELADPRFDLVARGSATTITALNGKWAVPGTGYGESIDRLLARMAATRPAAPNGTAAWGALGQALLARVSRGRACYSDAPGTLAWRGLVVPARSAPAYRQPGGRGEAAGTLAGGAPYPSFAVTRDGEWYQVSLPAGGRGWVSAADLRVIPAPDQPPAAPGAAIVVLDPGHGGQEAGAISAGGLAEKEPNLDIARKVAARLAGTVGQVWLTRSADTDVTLAFRSDLANASGGNLFLSIHHNAGSGARGTETYYQAGSEQTDAVREASRRLGCLVQAGVLGAIGAYQAGCGNCCPPLDRGVISRLLGQDDLRDYYFVLRNTFIPAALVEVAFVTDAREEACLQQEAFREAVADGIARAITGFLGGARAPSCKLVGPYYGL